MPEKGISDFSSLWPTVSAFTTPSTGNAFHTAGCKEFTAEHHCRRIWCPCLRRLRSLEASVVYGISLAPAMFKPSMGHTYYSDLSLIRVHPS